MASIGRAFKMKLKERAGFAVGNAKFLFPKKKPERECQNGGLT